MYPWMYPPMMYPQPQQDRNIFLEIDGWIKGLKELKHSLKEEDKKDTNKPRAKHYNGLEVAGLLMFLALPAGIGQLMLLGWFRDAMLNVVK